MDVNLLGGDDDHELAPNLPPALLPQQPGTPAASAAERLEQLQVASDGDAHDEDDFGDFLHSEAATDAMSVAEEPGVAAEQPGEQQGPADTAAAQLLAWISGVPEDRQGADSPPGAAAVAAWESAEGLLGGTSPGLHLAEIATRLCSAIPPWPPHSESVEASQPPAAAPLDLPGCIAEPAAAARPPLDGARLAGLTYGLVWPMYTDRGPDELRHNEEASLVDAYLRLAEKVGPP
ncbi:hypothetical protein IWQ56_007113 [Coemansia nantahalensis]|uniref:Uncharacterized protein n=1 Tax=Coemansia helicoidea TaxID=1286919 RepID=A0ACC1L3A7_9FUNG|nr:hypothetical protein IWQ56_007113 [Coemansia nantahalensis]KAJ2800109.1 hypothetical protein H4R21_003303 [Coemansia helicoidea]